MLNQQKINFLLNQGSFRDPQMTKRSIFSTFSSCGCINKIHFGCSFIGATVLLGFFTIQPLIVAWCKNKWQNYFLPFIKDGLVLRMDTRLFA